MRWVKAVAVVALAVSNAQPAPAQTLHVTYAISLLGLPLGTGKVTAEITPKSYSVEGSAQLNALARLVNNSHGASTGHGAIVDGRISPATFATTAANASSTRTIRMAMKGNAVAAVDIAPPFGPDAPDRVPLRPQDEHNIVDPIGAYVFPAPKTGPALVPADCERTLPIFDGYTRFDLKLSYSGEQQVKAKGYNGPVVVCAVRFVPVAGHRKERPAIKFMTENRDIQIWLAPVAGEPALAPYKISIRTMVGVLDIEATEFSVSP